MDKKDRLGTRTWSTLLLFGLFGQLAWGVENMYFNLFLYNKISGDPHAIAWMVAASAATATITTMLIGALSDRVSRRKIFISVGYILWGISTMAFAFISVDKVAKVFTHGNAIAIAAALVVIMDCIMTFFGSTANDCAFNAWVTDVTDSNNRGRVEGVLATLPLVAMLVLFGGFDILVQQDNWPLFFLIIGGMVSLGGIIGIFLIKESNVRKSSANYWETLIYGFKPSTIKANPVLYLYLIAFALFGIAIQIFFPYLIIYIQRYLGIDSYAIVLGIVLIVSSVVSVVVGTKVTAKNKNKFIYPSAAVLAVGLLLLFFVKKKEIVFLVIAGAVMMSGDLIMTSVLSAKVRDYTPLDKVGHFQGIRMIFYVLLPMVIGPFIGAAVITNSGQYYDDLGTLKPVPTPGIFLAAAITVVLIAIPLFFAFKKEKSLKKAEGAE